MKDQQFTATEVAKHNSENDIWVAIHGKVYNLSTYLDEHPGGKYVMLAVAGQDASEDFDYVGHSSGAKRQLSKLQVGVLADYKAKKLGTGRVPTVVSATQTQKTRSHTTWREYANIAGRSSVIPLAVGMAALLGVWYRETGQDEKAPQTHLHGMWSGVLLTIFILILIVGLGAQYMRKRIYYMKGVFEYESVRPSPNLSSYKITC